MNTPTPRQLLALRLMIGFSLISTTLHYTHNFIRAADYPPVEPLLPDVPAYRIGIIVAWPVLTGLGIWGYRRFREGRWREAALAELAYAMLGFTSILHYLGGVPQIPLFFTITMFTDFLAGSLLIGFAVWAFREDRRRRPGPSAEAPTPPLRA
jgi:hypothetical protein